VKASRVHLLGASGSGTSTLGRALAARLGCPWFDNDDFFWEATSPPYSTQRPVPERQRLLRERLGPHGSWVLSGSMLGWGDFLRTELTQVVFLSLPPEERLARIQAREHERHGARILPGGDLHRQNVEFLAWAARYDTGGMEVRSRVLHEAWLRSLPCPLLRLSGLAPTEWQVESVLEALGRSYPEARVETLTGLSAAPVVNPFYAGLGRGGTVAREGDVFFVARSGAEVLGAVRYCVEEGSALLRGMLIAEEARKKGIGRMLLTAFDGFTRSRGKQTLYCVPYGHLESFYATIGFRAIPLEEGPPFLAERVRRYREDGMPSAILMKRSPIADLI